MRTQWTSPGLRGRVLYAVLATLAAGLVSVVCQLTVARRVGRGGRLPGGPLVVIANHTSFADGLLLALVARRHGRSLRLLATGGVFDHGLVGPLVRRLGFIPVRRGTAQARDALAPATEALEAGEAVGLFPEGRITRDEQQWPEQGKTGAVRLALASGAPIVPVAISGAHDLAGRRRTTWLLLRSLLVLPRIHVLVGDPIDVTGAAGGRTDECTIRVLTDEVMEQLTRQLEEVRGQRAPHPHGVRAS